MRHRGGTFIEGNLKGMTSFLTQASGKRSIALDINTKEGKKFLENF